MFGGRLRVAVVVAVVGLVGGFVVPAGATSRTEAQGVTDDAIQVVVIVPDTDALIARGIAGGQPTQGFLERFIAHAEAFGPIRGRDVDVIKVAWDPQDATSFDKACTQATIDNKPFVVVNGSGFRDSAVPCVTVDNNTPYMTGDPMQLSLVKESGKNLLTLGLPPEVAAKEGVRMLDRTKSIPKSAKIGIISSNIPGVKLAGDALETELTKRGYKVASKVELNGLASDANLLRTQAANAAPTFQAAGIDTVFNVQSFTQVGAYFDEAARLNYKPQMYAIDGQANTCTKDGAARMSPNATGTICITTFDAKAALDGTGIRPDNALEAKCRAEFEAIKGFKTSPNAPSSGITVNGVKYNEDFSPWECMITSLLLPAIQKAGKNPTWDKVHANILKTTKAPAAYMSDGEGGFGPNKPYFANNIHMMKLSLVSGQTPKDANGTTYAGCPGPYSCWVPMTVDGQEWFPITTSTGKS